MEHIYIFKGAEELWAVCQYFALILCIFINLAIKKKHSMKNEEDHENRCLKICGIIKKVSKSCHNLIRIIYASPGRSK